MPSTQNPFLVFTLPELAELRVAYKQCLLDIATAGKSYSIQGRTFTRADIQDVKDTLSEIGDAITSLSGRSIQFATPVFHRGYFPGDLY